MSENPYTAPVAVVFDTEEEGYCELAPFSPQGRIGRLRLLAYSFGYGMLATLAIGSFFGAGFLINETVGLVLGTIAYIILFIGLTVLNFIFIIKRLHDLNQTGWLSLLYFVPLVNLLFYLYLMFAPGTPGANQYGKPPPQNGPGVVFLAVSAPFIAFVLGILAAIAIPAYDQYQKRAKELKTNPANNSKTTPKPDADIAPKITPKPSDKPADTSADPEVDRLTIPPKLKPREPERDFEPSTPPSSKPSRPDSDVPTDAETQGGRGGDGS